MAPSRFRPYASPRTSTPADYASKEMLRRTIKSRAHSGKIRKTSDSSPLMSPLSGWGTPHSVRLSQRPMDSPIHISVDISAEEQLVSPETNIEHHASIGHSGVHKKAVGYVPGPASVQDGALPIEIFHTKTRSGELPADQLSLTSLANVELDVTPQKSLIHLQPQHEDAANQSVLHDAAVEHSQLLDEMKRALETPAWASLRGQQLRDMEHSDTDASIRHQAETIVREELRSRIEDANRQVILTKRKMQEMETIRELSQAELDQYKRNVECLVEDLQEKMAKLREENAKLRRSSYQITSIIAENEALKEDVKRKDELLKKLKLQISSLIVEKEQADSKVRELQTQLAFVTETPATPQPHSSKIQPTPSISRPVIKSLGQTETDPHLPNSSIPDKILAKKPAVSESTKNTLADMRRRILPLKPMETVGQPEMEDEAAKLEKELAHLDQLLMSKRSQASRIPANPIRRKKKKGSQKRRPFR